MPSATRSIPAKCRCPHTSGYTGTPNSARAMRKLFATGLMRRKRGSSRNNKAAWRRDSQRAADLQRFLECIQDTFLGLEHLDGEGDGVELVVVSGVGERADL